MTTTADLIAEARQYFLAGIREEKNKLTTTMNTSVTSVTWTHDTGAIQVGSILTIGLERMYVWTVSGQTATVERGWEETTPAAHTAGDIISINARCDDFAIFRALNNELSALTSPNKGLYRVASIDLTYNPSTYGYDLDGVTDIIGAPLQVLAEGTGAGEWDEIPRSLWAYNASADADDFPSGRSLILNGAGTSGLKVRFLYRAPFVALTALTDDMQDDVELPATANDIPPMGAALQLASARPMQRADVAAQGSSRRAEETSTQDTLISVGGLRSRYEDRIRDEAMRLVAQYPVTF